MASIHAVLHRLYRDLDKLPREAVEPRLRARLKALSEADRAALDRWTAAEEREDLPDAMPHEGPPGRSRKNIYEVFPGAQGAPADPGTPFDPLDLKYDTAYDWVNWLLQRGPVRLGQLLGEGFYRAAVRRNHRCHTRADAPWSSATGFRYAMPECTDEAPLRLAVFGDAGMETGPFAWVAPAMGRWLGAGPRDRSFALHLGDIYYSGDEGEIGRFFGTLRQHLGGAAEIWSIPGDHERFAAGGAPFWAGLDGLRRDGLTRQQGGYFSLQNSEFQLVALDTFAEDSHRIPPDEPYDPASPELRPGHAQWAWIREVLLGHGETRTNLFFGQSPPVSKRGAKAHAWKQLRLWRPVGPQGQPVAPHLERIHGWFWGDVHHAAVYLPTADRPFVGFLAGHAARPATIPSPPVPAANVVYWETAPRYPAAWAAAARPNLSEPDRFYLDLQQRRVRNGWVQVLLRRGGTVRFAYVDWLGAPRFSGTLRPTAAGVEVTADNPPEVLP